VPQEVIMEAQEAWEETYSFKSSIRVVWAL